jgi:hypothetical protein
MDFVLCTAYFVFVLTFPHPGLCWIYGNEDDDDDDDDGIFYSNGDRALPSFRPF